ncbi:unnamed protein product [Lactuca saligna]|uniref:Protein kinase domain-containing protein n=1 Tax=Lactuca saligna TaxID=75948 RepID=A0AA36EP77_LACSI|nr:unnamed protein product [Lactuca saligna]
MDGSPCFAFGHFSSGDVRPSSLQIDQRYRGEAWLPSCDLTQRINRCWWFGRTPSSLWDRDHLPLFLLSVRSNSSMKLEASSDDIMLPFVYSYKFYVDLWSAGCILAELFAGKPIMPRRTKVEQLHKIFKLCGSPSEEYWRKSKLPHATIFKPQQPYKRCVGETFKDFPPFALMLLDSLLAFEPHNRGSSSSALHSEIHLSSILYEWVMMSVWINCWEDKRRREK